MKIWKLCLFAKKNGLEATIMSSQVDSVPYVHKKKWISVNLSKNEKLFHLTIWRPCHNVWWQFISAENQINSNTRSLFFGGTKHSSWNKTLIFLDCWFAIMNHYALNLWVYSSRFGLQLPLRSSCPHPYLQKKQIWLGLPILRVHILVVSCLGSPNQLYPFLYN